MNEIYMNFLERVKESTGSTGLIDVYHAIRNIPYGSTGVREPSEVIRGNLGSCSGKHLALRDLLRQTGHAAEIITMFTYFNERTPVVESFPDELKRMCRADRIPDFHHYVRVAVGGAWIKLDATWHDAMIPYGFPVNHAWNGQGDTILAADPIREYPNVEDLITRKQQLIDSLPADEREKRARFFGLLTDWIASL